MANYPPLVVVNGRMTQLAAADALAAALVGPVGLSQAGVNTALGFQAMLSITTGVGNAAFGYQACTALTTGQQNFGMGYQACARLTTGSFNLGLGGSALNALVSGSGNAGVGAGSLFVCLGGSNTALGSQSGYACTTGSYNTLLGVNAGQTFPTTGIGNTVVGANAGTAAAGTNNSLALGYGAISTDNECAFSYVVNVQTGYGSSSTQTRPRADLTDSWVDATDATRKARRVLHVWDTVQREGLRIEASGTAPMIGFLGALAQVRPTVTGSRGGNAALASLLTALANMGLITDSSTA